MGTPLELESSLWGKTSKVSIDCNLAHLSGLAYGDGYPAWGEIRVVTSNAEFKNRILESIRTVAQQYRSTFRVYTRPGNISKNPQHNVVLNSTLVRRALFDDEMRPNYTAIHSIAMDNELAAHFQAGLTDAEGNLLNPIPIEYPHGRIFAVINSDRRLLGISRLSLVNKLRLEPSSVRTRMSSKRGRKHRTHGIEIITRKNSYLIEVLSGAKRKWLTQVGALLWHPSKSEKAKILLSTYGLQPSETLSC